MTQRINEQIGAPTAIESECHFLKVGRKMLCRNLMPRTKDAALQERESGFDPIRGNFAFNVDLGAVVDAFVSLRLASQFIAFG